MTASIHHLSTEDVQMLLRTRLSAYNLLRWAFIQEPTSTFLDSLTSMEVLEQFPFQENNKLLQEGIREILSSFKSNHESVEMHQAIHWDYTRMFIGPHKPPVPLWESVYLNKEKLLFQEETLAVRRAYLKYAFISMNYGHEADDHIGLELDFMYQLVQLAIDKLQEKDFDALILILLDQRDFLEGHLLKWVGEFCQKVMDNAQTGFYRGMSNVLKGYLNIDKEALEELLSLDYSKFNK